MRPPRPPITTPTLPPEPAEEPLVELATEIEIAVELMKPAPPLNRVRDVIPPVELVETFAEAVAVPLAILT